LVVIRPLLVAGSRRRGMKGSAADSMPARC